MDGVISAAAPPPAVRVAGPAVLTLWAAVVAGRLGHPPAAALSLAGAVAARAARVEARRRRRGVGWAAARPRGVDEEEDDDGAVVVRLLGVGVRLATAGPGGAALALGGDGRAVGAAPVRAYLARAFGDRLAEVRAAMEGLADTLPAEALNRVGLRLYAAFRPDASPGARGSAAMGELRLEAIGRARA